VSRRKEGPNSDPVVQGKLRSRENSLREQRKRDIAAVLELPAGRRFMYDLVFNRLALMDVYLSTDIGIQRHEGKREEGQKLANELQTDHTEMYMVMIYERMKEQEQEQKTRDAALTPSAGERSEEEPE
jgi:hypothetical protein